MQSDYIAEEAIFRDARMPSSTMLRPSVALSSPTDLLHVKLPTATKQLPAKPSTSLVQPAPTLRQRGDAVDLSGFSSGRTYMYDHPSVPALRDLCTVPLLPLGLASANSAVVVRADLGRACAAVDTALAELNVAAVAVREGVMSFIGGVNGQADIFVLDVYADLPHVDDAGQVWPQHVFVLDALEPSRQPAVDALAQALARSVACR